MAKKKKKSKKIKKKDLPMFLSEQLKLILLIAGIILVTLTAKNVLGL